MSSWRKRVASFGALGAILGAISYIWRSQNKVQGLGEWGNIVERCLDGFCELGTLRIYL
jgi:hypothetical protein